MSDGNKAILTEANAAISRGDHEEFLSYCTDDVEWIFVGDRTLTGKEAVRQYLKEAYIEPPKFTVGRLLADGEFVIAVGEIHLKDRSDHIKSYDYCDIWRIRNGKLAGLNAFVTEIDLEARATVT